MPLKSPKLIVAMHQPFTAESMQGKDWVPVMDLGLRVLDKNGIHWQLGSGTLLGMMREDDGLIPHDTDIDIDIIINNPASIATVASKLITDFASEGFILVRTQHHEKRPSQIAFIHTDTNIIFDLCFFYNLWADDYFNVYEHGIFIKPAYNAQSVPFEKFNRVYFVPKSPKQYLEMRYGEDWMVPKHMKESGEKDAARLLVQL